MDNNLIIKHVLDVDFSKVGKVISIPTEGSMEPLLESDFFKHYGPLGYIACSDSVEFGITTFNRRELVSEQLEQHAKTPELLFAIDGDFVMPVAPKIIINGEEYPNEDEIMAIHVKRGEGVIFDNGMWHWAPYPYGDRDHSSVLVGFRKDTATTDIIIKDLNTRYILVKEK